MDEEIVQVAPTLVEGSIHTLPSHRFLRPSLQGSATHLKRLLQPEGNWESNCRPLQPHRLALRPAPLSPSLLDLSCPAQLLSLHVELARRGVGLDPGRLRDAPEDWKRVLAQGSREQTTPREERIHTHHSPSCARHPEAVLVGTASFNLH